MKTLCSAAVLLVVLGPAVDAGNKTPFSVADMFRFDGPRDVTVAPDGKSAVFIRAWIDAKTKQDRYALWRVAGPSAKPHALEKDQADARVPLFSPDGKWIVFLSSRPRPRGWRQTPAVPPQSDDACDLWVMPAGGGKAMPLAGPDKPYGRVFHDGFYDNIAFSPDGSRLVFAADDGVDPRTAAEIENDVLVVRPDQGEGYEGYRPSQIWIAHLGGDPRKIKREYAASKIERLTKDEVWYGDPQWSPDGKSIVVTANKTGDVESVRYSINKDYDLWAIDIASKTQRRLTDGPGPEVSPRFTAKGDLVCLSIPRKGSHRDVFNLAVVKFDARTPAVRILFDHHGKDADHPPHPRPDFPLPRDGDSQQDTDIFYYRTADGVTSRDARVDLRTGKGEVVARPANKSAKPAPPFARAELRRKFTPAGNSFLKDRLIGPSKIVTWHNEGWDLEGILTLPPAGIAGAPYKLLVHPHGGPHSRSTLGFSFTTQLFASQGYAVFQPNFRGSYGRSQKFIDADRNDFGGADLRDVLTGIDMLVKKGFADKNRQYVYGTSYGGYMTTSLVGVTRQFKAAVAQNPVTDLNMMWGLSDLQSWTEWEFKGYPWEVTEAMHKHSPLSRVHRVQTPTLLLQSLNDRRVPLPMAKAFHRALLTRGVPTEMVIYPGEGHGIRQPRHRADVYQRVLAWFEKHR